MRSLLLSLVILALGLAGATLSCSGAKEPSTKTVDGTEATVGFQYTADGDLKIHPFQPTQLDAGRWKVTTTCDYNSTTTGTESLTFEWIFYEDGPRLEAFGGRAADVTGQ